MPPELLPAQTILKFFWIGLKDHEREIFLEIYEFELYFYFFPLVYSIYYF